MPIYLKRVYEKPSSNDGYRVLVDGLWPRGLSKDAAKIDIWLKQIAPTANLRTWFGHDPKKWTQFKTRYSRELDKNMEDLTTLVAKARKGRVTLLFAAKDEKHNNATALKAYLARKFRV